MIVIAIILGYAMVAAAAMFFAIKWNKKYKVIYDYDIAMCAVFVSIFWPVAFPVYAAYIFANALNENE